MNARYGHFLVAKKVILTKIAFLWKASECLPIIRITKANQTMFTKKVLLKQNSANAYEESFAKAKLLGGNLMSFSELLTGFIGRTVEVFLTNQVYSGVLLSVDDCLFTIQTSGPYYYYYSPPTQVTIIADAVQYVRVITP
ncbi:hypothetical protein D3C73_772840 [compost metagenome]